MQTTGMLEPGCRVGVAASGGGGIYDHKPFPIVVNYANDEMGSITDTLPDCKITKFDGGGGSQGDSNVSAVTCEFTILSPIIWNGTPAKKATSGLKL